MTLKITQRKQKGFTLVELVTVMIILGILATGASQFLHFGTRTYTDASDREELIASARFVIERMNREIRNALPNSIRVTSNTTMQCLEYTPIVDSVVYLDISVAPEPSSNTIEYLLFDGSLPSSVKYLSVYALNSQDIYNRTAGVIEQVASINESADNTVPSTVTLTRNVLFLAESPTKRLYFIDTPIAFCMENGAIYRYQNYSYSSNNTPVVTVASNRVLMAEYLSNDFSTDSELPFKTLPTTLQRNAMVLTRLKFSRNLEDIVFNNEIQVANVP